MWEFAGTVEDADGREDEAHGPPAVPVCQGPGGAAQEAGGEVTGHEKEGDVSLSIPVLSSGDLISRTNLSSLSTCLYSW